MCPALQLPGRALQVELPYNVRCTGLPYWYSATADGTELGVITGQWHSVGPSSQNVRVQRTVSVSEFRSPAWNRNLGNVRTCENVNTWLRRRASSTFDSARKARRARATAFYIFAGSIMLLT